MSRLEGIAERFGVSRQHIHQILKTLGDNSTRWCGREDSLSDLFRADSLPIDERDNALPSNLE